MGFSLAPTALAQGYSLEAHDSVGSTNALALERALSGDVDRHWIVARRQEAGRGRRGRAWADEGGNLASTLLLTAPSPVSAAATLGFVAGLALKDALTALAAQMQQANQAGAADRVRQNANCSSPRFELKWPNDVMADGAKLAGILLESTLLKDGRQAVAVGIGVNIAARPEGLPYSATSLRDQGMECNAEQLFLALSEAWVENFHLWNSGRGLGAIRSRWLENAAGLGQPVAVRIEGRVVSGTFETIDESCRFVIRGEDGTMTAITAGDVHFGTVASAAAR